MSATRIRCHIRAPRALVYQALLDAQSVAHWMVPSGMTSRIQMQISYTLADAGGGTDLVAVHDRLPKGLSVADNESGWRLSVAKLAAPVEERHRSPVLDMN